MPFWPPLLRYVKPRREKRVRKNAGLKACSTHTRRRTDFKVARFTSKATPTALPLPSPTAHPELSSGLPMRFARDDKVNAAKRQAIVAPRLSGEWGEREGASRDSGGRFTKSGKSNLLKRAAWPEA